MIKTRSKMAKKCGFGVIFLRSPNAKISYFLGIANIIFSTGCAVSWDMRPDSEALRESTKTTFLENQRKYQSLKRKNNWAEIASTESEETVNFYDKNGDFSGTATARNWTKK